MIGRTRNGFDNGAATGNNIACRSSSSTDSVVGRIRNVDDCSSASCPAGSIYSFEYIGVSNTSRTVRAYVVAGNNIAARSRDLDTVAHDQAFDLGVAPENTQVTIQANQEVCVIPCIGVVRAKRPAVGICA